MLLIPITETNTDILAAANGGVVPAVEEGKQTYLAVESGEVNRIVTREQLRNIPDMDIRVTTRKMLYIL